MKDDLKLVRPEDFPTLLQEIPDAPKKLYLRGTLPAQSTVEGPPDDLKWLTVVGSRALTQYGRQACEYLIEGLRGYPIVIVSGLAYGADALAHKTALAAGLPCVGVPGSGLNWDVLYPRANVGLAREIVAKSGVLLSEFEPGLKAADYTFPQRNRIMAGLSHATLIIEAKEKSGTLITARLATEYNRELLVVPGSIFSPQSRGVHQFLKLGATPATGPEDILKVLNIDARTSPTADVSRADLSPQEVRVLEIVSSPCSRDELLAALNMPISEANILLSTMELKGLILEELGVVRPR